MFDETVASAIMLAHVSKPANPLSAHRPDLRPLDPVFARALAKDPAQRYPDCSSFVTALRASTAAPKPNQTPPPAPMPPRIPTPPPVARAASGPRWDALPPASTAPGWLAPVGSGTPSASVPTAPARSAGWKIAQCLWVLVPFLTCGVLGPAGYLYCAIRINSAKWWTLFGGSVALWIACAAVIGTVPTESTVSDVALFVLWLLPTIVGLAMSPVYLRDLQAKTAVAGSVRPGS